MRGFALEPSNVMLALVTRSSASVTTERPSSIRSDSNEVFESVSVPDSTSMRVDRRADDLLPSPPRTRNDPPGRELTPAVDLPAVENVRAPDGRVGHPHRSGGAGAWR